MKLYNLALHAYSPSVTKVIVKLECQESMTINGSFNHEVIHMTEKCWWFLLGASYEPPDSLPLADYKLQFLLMNYVISPVLFPCTKLSRYAVPVPHTI